VTLIIWYIQDRGDNQESIASSSDLGEKSLNYEGRRYSERADHSQVDLVAWANTIVAAKRPKKKRKASGHRHELDTRNTASGSPEAEGRYTVRDPILAAMHPWLFYESAPSGHGLLNASPTTPTDKALPPMPDNLEVDSKGSHDLERFAPLSVFQPGELSDDDDEIVPEGNGNTPGVHSGRSTPHDTHQADQDEYSQPLEHPPGLETDAHRPSLHEDGGLASTAEASIIDPVTSPSTVDSESLPLESQVTPAAEEADIMSQQDGSTHSRRSPESGGNHMLTPP
jgi:hypothetical protein